MVIWSVFWQFLTFVACIVTFDYFERSRAARVINRSEDFLFNAGAMALVVVVGTAWTPIIDGGLRWSGVGAWVNLWAASIHALGSAVKVPLAIVLADFSLYWVHRAMHGPDVLWRTHAFHHTVRHLYWLAGSRTSVTHLFLYAVPQTLIASYILSTTADEAAVGFSFGVVANFWAHTNLTVPLGPLGSLLITPQYHRLHHARDMKACNFGAVFVIWDRMFGTYLDPASVEDDFPLGLNQSGGMPRMILGV